MDTGLQCVVIYGSEGVDATFPNNVFTIPGNGSWSIVGGRARGLVEAGHAWPAGL